MDILIGEKIIKPENEYNYVNCYVVEIDTMYGDGDIYGKVTVGGFEKDIDEASLIDLLETVKRIKEVRRASEYGHDDGFYKWFCADLLDDDDYEELNISEREIYLITDWDSYRGDSYKYVEHSIFYYDENGLKYEAIVNL